VEDEIGPKERLLAALLEDPAGRHYGYDLMNRAQVQSGTLYPQLARLERQGVIASSWDTSGRRPRKYYTLTGAGERAARLELAALRSAAHAARESGSAAPRPAFGGAS
jgi:PadR family transcriptional regulator, regulatory protein PadR